MEELRQTSVDGALLVETYQQRLLYFALRRLRDRALAEEVAQETLTVVLLALRDNRIEDEAKLPGFIFGVAKNLVCRATREQANRAQSDPNHDADIPGAWLEDPDAGLLLEEQRQQVRSALAELSVSDRDILYRAFTNGQPLEEIAGELGIPYASARKRKSRALERLRKIFLERSQKKPEWHFISRNHREQK